MYFNESYANYLTNLDTLFDTRLALMNIMFPKFVDRLIESNQYTDRLKDVFTVDGVTLGYDTLLPFYRLRKKSILKYSGLTFIPYIIACEVNRHQHNSFNGECFRPWNIHINTYPYVLNDDEKKNVSEIFFQYMEERPDIIFHYLKPSEVTPEFLNDHNIEVVIDYYGMEWLSSIMYESNYKFIDRKFSLCVPKIMNTSGLDVNQMDDEFFRVIEVSFGSHIELSFLDSYAFSDRLLQMKKNIDSTSVEV